MAVFPTGIMIGKFSGIIPRSSALFPRILKTNINFFMLPKVDERRILVGKANEFAFMFEKSHITHCAKVQKYNKAK